MKYKIGDIYIEKVKVFKGFNKDGKVITREFRKKWTIVDINKHSITCKSNEKYKIFQM